MQVNIGDRIKNLRKRDGRKQEDLAKALGVTAQAVSRWESNGCYPDMNMIPAIANYFHVSIDSLFGYNNDREARIRELDARFNKARIEMRPGDDLDSLIDELRKSLEEFPGEPKFLRLLALSLADKGRNESETPKRYIAEAAEIYEELLKESNSYIDGLLDTYTLMGEYEKAEKKATEQPPLRNSREVLLASIEYKRAFDTGYKGRKYTGEAILTMLTELYFVLSNAVGHNEGLRNSKEALRISMALKSLFEVVFDGDFKEYHSYMCLLSLDCAEYSARLKDYDEALSFFDEAYDHLEGMKTAMDADEDTPFKALLLDEADDAKVSFPYLSAKVFDRFLNDLPKTKKNKLMKNPKYALLRG
ncbi:MAG: helix-turn-helix transcriptional regulator [Lachnospiraceae bacterium]|nr:helix-turn-helix transcriptional regulator [Lachnospiraceae bacterium]